MKHTKKYYKYRYVRVDSHELHDFHERLKKITEEQIEKHVSKILAGSNGNEPKERIIAEYLCQKACRRNLRQLMHLHKWDTRYRKGYSCTFEYGDICHKYYIYASGYADTVDQAYTEACKDFIDHCKRRALQP